MRPLLLFLFLVGFAATQTTVGNATLTIFDLVVVGGDHDQGNVTMVEFRVDPLEISCRASFFPLPMSTQYPCDDKSFRFAITNRPPPGYGIYIVRISQVLNSG